MDRKRIRVVFLFIFIVTFFALIVHDEFTEKSTAFALDVGGVISSNTTYTLADSPVNVTFSLIVNEGITLTIDPGVELRFLQDISLQVNGELIARGTASQPIKFTLDPNVTSGNWGQILFTSTSKTATFDTNGNYQNGSIFEFCTVEKAGSAGSTLLSAIECESMAPFITNCTFENNKSQVVLIASSSGIAIPPIVKFTGNTVKNNDGKVSIATGIDVTVSNNTFDGNNNKLRGGGALVLWSLTTATIINNIITRNTANGNGEDPNPDGGGIWGGSVTTVIIKNNKITGNTSPISGRGGGGIYIEKASLVTISGNTIEGNDSKSNGGGIYISDVSTLDINNNNVNSNSAGSGTNFNGGGIYTSSVDNVTITNNTVTGNSTGNLGGGIYLLSSSKSSISNITNNIISGNISAFAAGIQSETAEVIVSDNTFNVNNTNADGGTVSFSAAKATVTNNIITQNNGRAIWATITDTALISGNIITKNITNTNGSAAFINEAGNGITIVNNEISQNTTISSSSAALDIIGNVTVNNNNILNNTGGGIANRNAQGTSNIDATNNWWGTTDVNSIRANEILDFFRDGSRGIVDIEPLATGAIDITQPVTPTPTITSFIPTSAMTGDTVTINGTNFTGATSVSFGGTAASSFTVNSDAKITAVVGSGSAGNVSVTTSNGNGSLSGFTFITPPDNKPTITSFTPTSATTGDTVTINGTNFTAATSVSFGGRAASSFTVNSDATISAVVGLVSTGNVSVTTSNGSGSLSGFTFITPPDNKPTITSFTPTSATTGDTVTINGTNFTGATSVNFGGTAASSFTVNSDAKITAVVGLGSAGNVSVTTSNGSVSLSGFTFVAPPTKSPNVDSINIAPAITGNSELSNSANLIRITINGQTGQKAEETFFVAVDGVNGTIQRGEIIAGDDLDNNGGSNFKETSTGQYEATYQPFLSMTDGTQIKILTMFKVDSTSLTNVSVFDISKNNIAASNTLRFDTIAPVVLSPAELLNSNINFPGQDSIVVTFSEAMNSDTLAPGESGVIVTSRTSGGIVTILTSVEANGDQATYTPVIRISESQDTFLIDFDSNVTDDAGNSINDAGLVGVDQAEFRVTNTNPGLPDVKPTISSFSPTSATTGKTVTISGSNFTGATSVSFGDTFATSFIIDSDTQISALVGSGSSGSVNVTTSSGTAILFGFTFVLPEEVCEPIAEFDADPLAGFDPLTVQFTDKSTCNPTSWAWKFGDGGTSSEQNPKYTYRQAGDFTVTLTVSNSKGIDTEEKLNLIKNIPVGDCKAAFSANPTSGITPLEVKFTDLSTGNPTSWAWEFGDGDSSSKQNPTHVYQIEGFLSVKLTISGDSSCGVDSLTKTNLIIAIFSSVVIAEFNANPTSGFSPLDVQFNNLSAGEPTSFAWLFGDGGSSSDKNPLYTYKRPGIFTVTLNASSLSADIESKTNLINIQSDEPPTTDFQASPLTGFAPLKVAFTDLSTGNIESWSWSFGDGASSILQNPLHEYKVPGFYNVKLIVSNKNGTGLEEKINLIAISEGEGPTAAFFAEPLTGNAPFTVNFIDTSSGVVANWNWEFGDGETSVNQNPAHTYKNPGRYNVRLTVSGKDGTSKETKTGLISVDTGSDPTAGFIVDRQTNDNIGSRLTAPADKDFVEALAVSVDGLTVKFSDLSSKGADTILEREWDFGDGSLKSNEKDPDHTYSGNTDDVFTVSLSVRTDSGFDTVTKQAFISLEETLTATPTPTPTPTPTATPTPVPLQSEIPTFTPIPTPKQTPTTVIASELIVNPTSAASSWLSRVASVIVLDQVGKPLSDVTITASVSGEGGKLPDVSPNINTTDSTGEAQFNFRFPFRSKGGLITFKFSDLNASIEQR